MSAYLETEQKWTCFASDYLFKRWWRRMEKKTSGKLSIKKTTSQMQTHWKSLTSLLSLSTGKHQAHISCTTTCTHTHTRNQQLPQIHLTLHQVLLYCSAQINHTDTQRDSSIWDFSVCQHLHSCCMQILITLPQLARGKERDEDGKKGDQKVGRAAEHIKEKMRQKD